MPGLVGRLLSGGIMFLVGAGMGCGIVGDLFTQLSRGRELTGWGWLILFGVMSLVFVVGGIVEIRNAIVKLHAHPPTRE